MPTAALYDSTRQHLAAQLTGALASQIDTLGMFQKPLPSFVPADFAMALTAPSVT